MSTPELFRRPSQHMGMVLLTTLAITGCAHIPQLPLGEADHAPLVEAESFAHQARQREGSQAARFWLKCARAAQLALADGADTSGAIGLANRCTVAWLTAALVERPVWVAGPTRILGVPVEVEFRNLSPNLGERPTLVDASTVSMHIYHGQRFERPGLGVPVAAVTPRCTEKPLCKLLPYSGVFRPATVWIEPDDKLEARVIVADPLRVSPLNVAGREVPVAEDTSVSYAYGMSPSPIGRLAIWGLLGGDDVDRRAGVYLMEDYAPEKRPLVMVHGLGSSPLAWARLSNAVWGDPVLRQHFQVWHLVYSTDDPLFVARKRIAGYLDSAWAVVDPQGDDPARHGMVLVGHSLGGVLSRLLCADTGQLLWQAAFKLPPADIPADPTAVSAVQSILEFRPYPGISRAIFLAAPHHGSPLAERWYARVIKGFSRQRVPEMLALQRIALQAPDAVQDALRASYQGENITSITTLQAAQPVRKASEGLMPTEGIAYHTIAGVLPGRHPPGDGVVPLSSALLPGADSTRVITSNHALYANDEAIAEVLRILRLDVESSPTVNPLHAEHQGLRFRPSP